MVSDEAYLERYQKWRRICFDVPAAAVLLVFLTPLFLLIAAMIRLDSRGNPIFTQMRVGRHGRLFRFYKFRSMYVDVPAPQDDPRVHDLNDQRITPVGKFLRPLEVDELLQVINVLKGDMSFLGPRPEMPSVARLNESECPLYFTRLRVLPGIVGPAAFQGSEVWLKRGCRTKLALDRLYMRKIGVRMDGKLIGQTILFILNKIAGLLVKAGSKLLPPDPWAISLRRKRLQAQVQPAE